MRVYTVDRHLTPAPKALTLWCENHAKGGVIVLAHRAGETSREEGVRVKPTTKIVGAWRMDNADALVPMDDNASSGDRQGIGTATKFAATGEPYSLSVLCMRDDDGKDFYDPFITGRG